MNRPQVVYFPSGRLVYFPSGVSTQIDHHPHHAEALEEFDVEGILAFGERVLPRASDLWVQSSLDHKQRLQQLFFPDAIRFDGKRFNRTAATAPFFQVLGAVREC